MFFEKIKRKFRTSSIMGSILCFCIACAAIGVAIWNGFSAESGWYIGVRGSIGGIYILDWIISVFSLGVSAVFLYGVYACIKQAIANPKYVQLLRCIEEFGNVETIGKMLEETEDCPYAKGCKLKINNKFLFQLKSDTAIIIPREAIKGVQAAVEQAGSSVVYFVSVAYERSFEFLGKTKTVTEHIMIQTSRRKQKKLMDYLEMGNTHCDCPRN